MAPQDSQNCGQDFPKRKQTDAEFAGNSLLRMVIIDIVSNTSVGGLTLGRPAGMYCPSWDDAFVSSLGDAFAVGCRWRMRFSSNNQSQICLEKVS